jgi:ribosomal protein L16 Arg81 hydroxylase
MAAENRDMDVQSIFGEMAVTKFVADYLHRLPLALTASAQSVCRLGNWQALGEVLGSPDANVLVVREGQPHYGARPANTDAAQHLSGEGYTIVVRHAERHHVGLGQLADAFARAFCGAVDIQMFATPPGAAGFSWHYDAEDVFIFQTAGEKEYYLRKNTVNPWPLEETLPQDMRYEREIMPLMRVTLHPGDLLYIPCGYWHKADAANSAETAISLAIGVMSRTAMDVFDALRPRLLESILWRQRLPITGTFAAMSPDELWAAYQELFAELASDVSSALQETKFIDEFLSPQPEEIDRRC